MGKQFTKFYTCNFSSGSLLYKASILGYFIQIIRICNLMTKIIPLEISNNLLKLF